MTTATQPQATDYACPKCAAPVGEPCVLVADVGGANHHARRALVPDADEARAARSEQIANDHEEADVARRGAMQDRDEDRRAGL